MIKETQAWKETQQARKEKWGLFSWENVVCEFVLRGDRAWGFRQKGKRQEADNEPDFVHMIGQRPRDYVEVCEKLRRIKDHRVFLQIGGEKKTRGGLLSSERNIITLHRKWDIKH